jgi:two-component system, sensor histidine kinase and response regulator
MTIKSNNKKPKKKKSLSRNLISKNAKRSKAKLIKSFPYELQHIADQLGNLSDLSLITDSKGKILLYGNPSTGLKFSRKIVTGKNIFLYIDTNTVKNKILKKAESKGNSTFYFQLECSKNKSVPVLSRWSTFVAKSTGHVFYLILNNIIYNPNSTDEQGFIGNINGRIIWTSTSKLKDRSTIYSNNLSELTGFSQSEINRKQEGFFSIIHKEDYAVVKKSYKNFVGSVDKMNANLIYRIVKKDKTVVWIKEDIILERTMSGKPIKAKGFISDLAELTKSNEVLTQRIESLKKQSESKDKFISILSHDLRAPFTSILGFAEILMNEQDLPADERHEYLSYIYNSSQNQLQLINYLLDWSRLQTNRMNLELRRINAKMIVFNCISSLTGNAIRKNIEIKVNINDKIYLQADERLLMQVITNLLSNSIKFSYENRSIYMNADIFNDELIEFVIKDQGIGITQENKLKLFKIEKMFSTDGTKGEKGTGLGLLLAKEIVERHKGNIWFYSIPGKGTEFHFTIKRSPDIILVVDNNKGDQKEYEELISNNFPAYKVICTSNGYEAMQIALNKLPSLIITDDEMPLMSGVRLIESIRRDAKNFAVPIILLTRELVDEISDQCNNMSVLAILQKPINTERFKEELNKVLDL